MPKLTRLRFVLVLSIHERFGFPGMADLGNVFDMSRNFFAASVRPVLAAAPGFAVLVAVLLLLRGFSGTAQALQLQASTLAKSFFGGEDELLQVMLQTTPLAIAAAVAVFCIASGWLRFESIGSLIALAAIVLIGAATGRLLPDFVFGPPAEKVATAKQSPKAPTAEDAAAIQLAIRSSADELSSPLIGGGLSLPGAGPNAAQASARPSTLGLGEQVRSLSAWEQLAAIDWLAEPKVETNSARQVLPLKLLPEVGSWPGFVFRAINQLCGYLVTYQPRLFLAAVLAGGWIGFRWQRRLASLQDQLTTVTEDESPMQQAA